VAHSFRLLLVAPGKTLYDGDAESVVIPAADGMMGVLAEHAPFLGLLRPGRVTVRTGTDQRSFNVSEGTVQVLPRKVTILSESAEPLSPDLQLHR
jgi:F-type H+-transporting ATPase subunit epsilon